MPVARDGADRAVAGGGQAQGVDALELLPPGLGDEVLLLADLEVPAGRQVAGGVDEQQVRAVLQHRAGEPDGVLRVPGHRDGAGPALVVHDGRVVLDGAVGGQGRTAAGVEQGSSSSCSTAAQTASSAVPPSASTARPAPWARRNPDSNDSRRSADSSSMRPPAPPCRASANGPTAGTCHSFVSTGRATISSSRISGHPPDG